MKRRVWFAAAAFAAAVFLSGCEEGKPMALTETEESTGQTGTSSEKQNSGDAFVGRDSLEDPGQGGTYRVESWKLYDNLAQAGLSADSLSDYGVMLSETGKDFKFLLVTVTRTSTADYEGNFPEQVNVNLFFPVTLANLRTAYLPEAEPDAVSRMEMEHGYEPVYLDIGKSGASNYFEISAPPEGESVTYSLGFYVSEEEYQAGENGELYLWYSMDEARSADELQLLFLSPELLQQ